jgi:hypothetical protein
LPHANICGIYRCERGDSYNNYIWSVHRFKILEQQ